MTTPRLVLIEWEDSHMDNAWVDLGGIEFQDRVLKCQSVGWLLYAGANSTVVAPHMTSDAAIHSQGTGIMTIPTRAIMSISNLTPDPLKAT